MQTSEHTEKSTQVESPEVSYFGFSAEAWDRASFWALTFAVIAAAAVALTYKGFSEATKREAHKARNELEAYKLTVEGKVSDAKLAGIRAGEEAGAAILKAAEANKRSAELEGENLLMRRAFSPRRITSDQHKVLVEALSKVQGTINIESMSDSESGMYAADILKTFTDAGWKVGNKEFPLGEIWTGLIIEAAADPATVAASNAFHAAGIECQFAQRGRPSVSILVGGKPRPF